MSHYAVAVFTKNSIDGYIDEIDELLKPYDEHIVVEPYVSLTKEQLIQRERKQHSSSFEGPYAEWQKDPEGYEKKCCHPEHIEYLKSLPDLLKQTDEQIYQHALSLYEGDNVSEDGSVLSTYNPQSKWDWYEIGGRWSGMLIFKVENQKMRSLLMPDSGFASEVDFEQMRERAKGSLQPYEQFIHSGFFTEDYLRERYPTEEEYIRRMTEFNTFAVVTPDGKWHAPGEMGWWATSSESHEERRDWDNNYHERFIKPAIENGWFMTIVDCHI